MPTNEVGKSPKLKDWLEAYMHYTSESEAPDSFHKWTALSIIAGVLQRRTWLDFGYGEIYPNLYILLVAPPGEARKGGALTIGEKMLKEVQGIKLGADSMTIEEWTRELAASYCLFEHGGSSKEQSAMSIVAAEYGSLLQTGDTYRMITRLTDWFDCKKKWEYRTKNQGSDVINGVCVNIIGGTTPDWLADFLPQSAIGGGFTSRIIFIFEREIRHRNYWPELSATNKLLKYDLIHDLKVFAKLTGPFIIDPDAKEAVRLWYERHHTQPRLILDRRFGGYYSRKQTHALKLSMVLAVARTGTMRITKQLFQEAIALLDAAEPGFLHAFGGFGRSVNAALIKNVMEFLRHHGQATWQELVSTHWMDATLDTLREALAVLEEMKEIRAVNGTDGVKTYHWKGGKK